MTRFRRTKDELARGLTVAAAMAERAYTNPAGADLVALNKQHRGDITIRIVPGLKVDPDYFEHLRGRVIEVTQDEHFYKWFDHLSDKVYTDSGQQKLVADILSEGIGEVLTTRHIPKDVK